MFEYTVFTIKLKLNENKYIIVIFYLELLNNTGVRDIKNTETSYKCTKNPARK